MRKRKRFTRNSAAPCVKAPFDATRTPEATMSNADQPSEFDSATTGDLVHIGDTNITVQQFQHIYNELTGRTESTNKYYDEPILADLHNIEQLHQYIKQMLEQYSVTSAATAFTVYYLKNTKDVFTSAERFFMQAPGGTTPIESVLIKYNFLIVLPLVRKPQAYTISVRLVSRSALQSKMRNDFRNCSPLSRS
jgi:hypothetical protein